MLPAATILSTAPAFGHEPIPVYHTMKRMYLLLIGLYALQLVLAFFCGPYSCKWGNSVYFYSGVANLLVAFILPFLLDDGPWSQCLVRGLLFLLGSAMVWVCGFMAFDFKIICRLI
jgi:hypothetical protein